MLINLAAFVVVVAAIISAKSLLIPFLSAIFLAIVYLALNVRIGTIIGLRIMGAGVGLSTLVISIS